MLPTNCRERSFALLCEFCRNLVANGIAYWYNNCNISAERGRLMRECIICGSQMSDDATTCGTCGFSSRRRFLSRTHYQSWMEQTVIPYREKWERQTESSVSPTETSPNSPEEKPVILRSSTNHPKKFQSKKKTLWVDCRGSRCHHPDNRHPNRYRFGRQINCIG